MAESRDGIKDSGVLATLSELDRVRSKLKPEDHWEFPKLSMLDSMLTHLEHRIVLLENQNQILRTKCNGVFEPCNCKSCRRSLSIYQILTNRE